MIDKGDLVQCLADAALYLPGVFQVVEVRPDRIKLRFDDHDEWRPVKDWAKVEDDTPYRARMLLEEIGDAVWNARYNHGMDLSGETLPDGQLVVADAAGREWIVTVAPRPADD